MATACPGAASAATARVDDFYPDYGGCKADCPDPIFEVVLVANPGERNDVTGTRDPDGAVVLHDAGAPVTAKRGCASIDANTVRCGDKYSELRVTVRDGDDTVTIVDGGAKVEGGAGNDRLTGGPQPDTLVGGPGNDELHGGAGDDRLVDGVARLRRGSANDDTFDGGDGTDWVDYAGRVAPVAIDLGNPAATAGQAGERDVLSGIENAAGGSASDVVAGDDSKNELTGGVGPGADTVIGADGPDVISVGPGDRVFGGPGADSIRRIPPYLGGYGTGLERVDCGPDVDVVEYPELHTLVGDSCENAYIGSYVRQHLPLAALGDPVLTFDQYTNSSQSVFAYSHHIELRASGIAMHRRHPKPGTRLTVADTEDMDPYDVRLSERGMALLRQYGRIRTRVIVSTGPVYHNRDAYLIDLRAPAPGSASP